MVATIDARSAYSRRSALSWLLVANAAVFVVLRLIAVAGVLSGNADWSSEAIAAASLPGSLSGLLARPWTLVTYMIAQYDPLHLMMNMLFLAWFGLYVQLDCGSRRLLAIYGAGGLAGALAYMVWSAVAVSDAPAGLIGSSASVIAVAVAIAVIEPERPVGLLFFGHLKMKWVAAIMIVVTVLFLSGYHAGSDAAHIGGAVAGMACGALMRRRKPSLAPAVTLPSNVTGDSVPAVEESRPSMTDTEALDSLLDKIRRSGYDSLSSVERMELFNISRRMNGNNQQ